MRMLLVDVQCLLGSIAVQEVRDMREVVTEGTHVAFLANIVRIETCHLIRTRQGRVTDQKCCLTRKRIDDGVPFVALLNQRHTSRNSCFHSFIGVFVDNSDTVRIIVYHIRISRILLFGRRQSISNGQACIGQLNSTVPAFFIAPNDAMRNARNCTLIENEKQKSCEKSTTRSVVNTQNQFFD